MSDSLVFMAVVGVIAAEPHHAAEVTIKAYPTLTTADVDDGGGCGNDYTTTNAPSPTIIIMMMLPLLWLVRMLMMMFAV